MEAGWIGKKEAVATLKACQALAARRGKDTQHIVIEMGVGWAGATAGFKQDSRDRLETTEQCHI